MEALIDEDVRCLAKILWDYHYLGERYRSVTAFVQKFPEQVPRSRQRYALVVHSSAHPFEQVREVEREGKTA